MTFDQLKPAKVLRGPIFPEPVEAIVTVPMGDAVKLFGPGVQTGKVVDNEVTRARAQSFLEEHIRRIPTGAKEEQNRRFDIGFI